MSRFYSIDQPVRERDGRHRKGKRGRLANRKAKALAAERRAAFMARYRLAIAGRDKGVANAS